MITPGEVLTDRGAPWWRSGWPLPCAGPRRGVLSMRAMSENADSARLSGVWVRRTSTVAWTLAGALSAFAAVLNAPGQTSALPRCSPDLLLYALTAALIGAMVNLTVAFVAGIGVGGSSAIWRGTSVTGQPAADRLHRAANRPPGAVGALRKADVRLSTFDLAARRHDDVRTVDPGCAAGSRRRGRRIVGGVGRLPPVVGRHSNVPVPVRICIMPSSRCR